MWVVYLILVFLLAREIENVHKPVPDSGNLNSVRSPSRDLNPKTLSGSNSNPSDRTKVKSGARDPQSTCRNECLVSKTEIRSIHEAHPHSKAVQLLYDRCGMVTDGKFNKGGDFPVCLCITLKESMEQRKTTLSTCRTGVQIMRQFTDAVAAMSSKTLANKKRTNWQEMGGEVEAVGMYDHPADRPITRRPRTASNRRPNMRFCCGPCGTSRTESPPLLEQQQQEEEDWNMRDDGQPEGRYLVTDVKISGKGVRALLDTGCDYSLIHPDFAGVIVPVVGRGLWNASGQQFQISGKTTISVEIRSGVIIEVTGYVINKNYAIVLGTDFYVTNKAKLRIFDRKMDILTDRTSAEMTIKFRANPAGVFMTSSSRTDYTALQVLVRVNGIPTRMIIDTGATVPIVTEELVKKENIRPVSPSLTVNVGGAGPAGFKGQTQIDLDIGAHSFTLPVLVPAFKSVDNFIVGSDFIKRFVEVIDYESTMVSMSFPNSAKITVPAIVLKGQ